MSQSPLPGHAEQPEEIVCASCGRFVGALTRCPHCGARVHARMSIRFFRYAALLLASVGLGLLYLMATHREIPVLEVGSIKPTMNFAYIRVAGNVVGEARVNREGGQVQSVRFIVDDGSGEIPVTAFRAKGQELVDLDLVPRVGDRVEVTGSLSVSAESIALWLQAPEQMTLKRAEVPQVELVAVDKEMLGRTITVEGAITRVDPPRQGSRRPWGIALKDATGEKDITFWQDVYDGIADPVQLAPGTKIRARVSVGSYRDRLQLRLAHAEDIEFVGGKVVRAVEKKTNALRREQPTPIGDLDEGMMGQTVTVAGSVAQVRMPPTERAPFEVVLQEGDDQVLVVYWDGVARRLTSNQPVEGALLQVRGQVNVYSNKLQVKVSRADEIQVLTAAEPR